MQVIHAGLVTKHDRGVLIGDPRGVGKSTTAMSCFLGGLDFLGDDQIVLEPLESGFVGHSIYNSAHIMPDWLPEIGVFPKRALDCGDHEGKIAIFLAEVFPERAKASTRIQAIILPTSGSRLRVRAASKGETLRRLAPSSLLTPLGGGKGGFALLCRLVDTVPAYWLELGTDTKAIPPCIESLMSF